MQKVKRGDYKLWKLYEMDGKFHRNHDLPAYTRYPFMSWFSYGEKDRKYDLPERIYRDGYKEYWRNNKACRNEITRPSIIWKDGKREFFKYEENSPFKIE
jgi:hypothetical protein